MAVQTFQYLRNYVHEFFLENYDEDITAGQLRVFLIDLLDTLEVITSVPEDEIRRGNVAVITSGTQITFTIPFDVSEDYLVLGMVYSGSAKVMHSEYDNDRFGFKVRPVAGGTFKYIAVPI